MAAAAEKPFMMLSVYFTTTEVYRPPTLDRTEVQREVGYKKMYQSITSYRKQKLLEDAAGDFVLHLQTTKHTQGVYPKKKPLSRTFSPSFM